MYKENNNHTNYSLQSIYTENLLINIKELNNYLKNINNNINDFLLLQLRNKIGNRCNNDGLVISNSIHIISRNCGTFIHNEKILYKIKFKATILFPTEGCILKDCKIIFISSILYIAKIKTSNLIVILPRNFIKTPIDVKKKKNINVICIDKYYELNDKYMFVIGLPYFDSLDLEKIEKTSDDDAICKNIFNNITEFKLEYENLFKKMSDIQDNELLIDYEITKEKEELNNSLVYLIENLNNHIEENSKTLQYKVTTVELSNYESICSIYDLFHLPLPSLTKFNLNVNIDLYEANKLKINYNNFINTDNSFTLNNNYINCYVTSSLQLLKNCKLFLKIFYDFFDNQEDLLDKSNINYKFYNELNKIFANNNNSDIENLIAIIEELITLNKLDFNFSTLNNINDFIHILFNLLDNTIDQNLYIKNVYDNVNVNIKSLKKTNTENTIGYYINKLNTSNNTSILNKFYNIGVNEYKCSNCLFRYYHIKNKLSTNLFINDNENISKCIHSLNINPTLVEGLQCNICTNANIYKSEYMYVNPTDYLLFNLNRVMFETNLEKNKDEIFTNNKINIKSVNINSTDYIKTNDYLLNLKSVVCQIGSLNNGHYITLNKTASDFFYLHDDSKKYIVTHDKFYTNVMFKSNICNLIYQVNNINSPLSDILLLRYENDVLHENYMNNFVEYIKDNNLVGINIKTKMLGGSQVTKVVDLDNILVKLYNLELVSSADKYIESLNMFFNDNEDIKLLDKELINNTLIEYFDKNVSTIFSEKDKFYDHLIQKYVNNLKYNLTNKNIDIIEFLSGTDLFKSVNNIYIGTSGYNTNKTNHWDVIYEISNNNLELYSNHFNTIEINDTYYQDFDSDYWSYLENNLSNLEGKMSVSVVFNKELSDVLLNHESLSTEDLEVKFNEIFSKYYEDKVSVIEEYIDNIVFIFESDFSYNETTLKSLELFLPLSSKYEPNFVFEFHNNSWFNNNVMTFLLKNDLNIVSLIINNNNNDFGYNLLNNISFVDDYDFKVNYVKLYGSQGKFNGSHSNDLLFILNSILHNCDKNNSNLSKLTKSNKTQFIYFNNIETDLNNKRYKTSINDLDIYTPKTSKQLNSSSDSSSEESKKIDTLEKEGAEVDQEVDQEIDQEIDDEDSEDVGQTIELSSSTLEDMSSNLDSETLTENLNIPSAVFDAKCLYNLLEKLNNLKK